MFETGKFWEKILTYFLTRLGDESIPLAAAVVTGFACSSLGGPRSDFDGGEPRANIEDGSSLIIHWSSRSHKRSTNWVNQYDIYFGGAPTGGGPGACTP